MDANTVTAVRPLLELWTPRRHGAQTGIQLINQGLSPAIITRTILELDGQVLGGWDEPTVDQMRASLPTRPRAMTIRPPRAIPTGFGSFLLSLDSFDREQHAWFGDLIKQRIQIEIHYESLYGGEDFKTTLHVDPPSLICEPLSSRMTHQPGGLRAAGWPCNADGATLSRWVSSKPPPSSASAQPCCGVAG